MKIAILTYFFSNNYGAVLQAVALQAALRKHTGEDVTFLPYCNILQRKNNALIQYGSLKAWCYNIIRLPFIGKRKKRIDRFNQFRRFYLNSDEIYVDDREIVTEAGRYDLIIVGSDQVWNPNAPDFSKIYFSIFNKKIHAYTYGVSLGDCRTEQLLPYVHCIKDLPQILVREGSAVNRLRDAGYKNSINVVLDPVLLHTKEEWETLLGFSESKSEKKYILCYFLRRKHIFEYWNVAKKIEGKVGCKLLCVNVNAGLFAYTHKTLMDAGPIEFLELIKGASLVLTNSFHGTVFSILFHIPFYSLYAPEENDSRIGDILRSLDLENRQLCTEDSVREYTFDIDYVKVDEILNHERQKSIAYLHRMGAERHDL